ncbi:hypothetical protein DBV05_g6174 [Lasiodiplodia theobromae]|uniref:Heat shock 70 kDa protein 12B n=2 Tax=Lasiodiplodia theobromae TaxID=45133 RepID=A0A5N5DE02_9PEZI|nr:hypothetical protein DBV05_g6174 [Lasiodiplodia theobromae]
MTRLQQNGHRIVVGVDFGTTYTGVSWVTTVSQQTIQEIDIINEWGGSGATGSYNWKVPTVIAYQNENSPWSPRGDKWGFQVKPEMVSWAWMKLLLDQDQAKRHYDDTLPEVKQHPHKSPEQIVTDFLSHVYKFLIGTLERRMTPSVVQQLPIEFWFTTPAIWSDQANHATRRAARAAGFGSRPGDRIFMIQEPEAAAVAVLKDLTVHGTNVIVKPGDGILICDCGGGTVDLITYKVTQTYPTLQFEELVVGSGGKCGSTYVDRRFLAWMSETFGPAFDGLRDRLKCPGSKMMQEFESHKRAFSSDNCEHFELGLSMHDVPDSPSYDASENTVKIEW